MVLLATLAFVGLTAIAQLEVAGARPPRRAAAPRPAVGLVPGQAWPEVFAPDVVSVGNVFQGSFTPDASEFYFFKNVTPGAEDYRIFVSRRRDGRWSEPERLELGGSHSDVYPAVSPDGRRLVFSSYRPVTGDDSGRPNAHLWYAERRGGDWGEPVFMAETTRLGQYHSQLVFDRTGDLYFGRDTADFRNHVDLFARWDGERYGAPQLAPAWEHFRDRVPEGHHLWETTPGNDGTYVILEISRSDAETGRPGPADLWFARRSPGGWGEARPVAGNVNTSGNENFVFYSPDGRFLYFVRDFNAFYRLPVAVALGEPAGR